MTLGLAWFSEVKKGSTNDSLISGLSFRLAQTSFLIGLTLTGIANYIGQKVSAYYFSTFSNEKAHLVVLSILEKLSNVVASDNTSLHISSFGQFLYPRVLGLCALCLLTGTTERAPDIVNSFYLWL